MSLVVLRQELGVAGQRQAELRGRQGAQPMYTELERERDAVELLGEGGEFAWGAFDALSTGA